MSSSDLHSPWRDLSISSATGASPLFTHLCLQPSLLRYSFLNLLPTEDILQQTSEEPSPLPPLLKHLIRYKRNCSLPDAGQGMASLSLPILFSGLTPHSAATWGSNILHSHLVPCLMHGFLFSFSFVKMILRFPSLVLFSAPLHRPALPYTLTSTLSHSCLILPSATAVYQCLFSG